MSDNPNLGFGKFVPGFDFLQNLAKGATQSIPQMPNLANWVAPTLNPEELEKRIEELKAVHFWLDQNSKRPGRHHPGAGGPEDDAGHAQGHELQPGRRGQCIQAQGRRFGGTGCAAVTETAESAAKTLEAAGRQRTPGHRRTRAGAQDGRAASPPTSRRPAWPPWWTRCSVGFADPAVPADRRHAMKDAGRNTAIDATRNMATGLAKEAVKAVAASG
jgi:hypothetical protein